MAKLGPTICAPAALCLLAGPVRAEADDDEIKLGPIQDYATEAEATAHCTTDGVV